MAGTDLGSIVAHLKLDMENFTNNLNVATNEIDQARKKFDGLTKVGQTMTTIGKGLTAGITVPVALMGKQVIETGAKFDTAMSKVKALSGANQQQFEQLSAKAREMGASTQFSATECADALGYMALAGWDTQQSIAGLPGILNLASASQMDLGEASDMVTDYLTAFGMEASDTEQFVDMLAYAQANSNTTTQQLGEAFKNCASNVHSFGMSAQETTAFLSELANQGLKGSEAGTTLSAMTRDITQKMENGAIQIGNTSVKVQDANGNFRSMTDIMTDVSKATDGMGTAQKNASLMSTFTADSIKGVNMILNSGTDSLKDYEKELDNSSGSAQKMADTMNDNLEGDIKKFKSALEECALQIHDKVFPAFRGIVQWATKLVTAFSKLPAPVMQFIVKLALILATIGPILLIFGKLISSIQQIYTTFRTVSAFIRGFDLIAKLSSLWETIQIIGLYVIDFITGSLIPALASLWAFLLANPVVLVIAVIGLLIGAFILLWNKCEGFRNFWINLWNTIKTFCINAWTNICNFFTVTVPQTINNIINWFAQLPQKIPYYLGYLIGYIAGWVVKLARQGYNAGKSFLTNLVNWFKSLPERIWTWLVNTYNKAVNWKNRMVKQAQETGRKFLQYIVNGIKSLPGRVWTWLVNTYNKVINWKNRMVKQAQTTATNFVRTLVNGLKNLPHTIYNIGVNIVQGLVNGIKSKATELWNTVSNMVSGIKKGFQDALKINSPSKWMRDRIGVSIPEGITVGMVKASKDLYKTVDTMIDNIKAKSDLSDFSANFNVNPAQQFNSSNTTAPITKQDIIDLKQQLLANKVDYKEMAKSFVSGASSIKSNIYMDKTKVGEKTSDIIKKTNDITNIRLNRLKGVLE